MPKRPEIERLKDEMEELFADLSQLQRHIGRHRGFRPLVDVYRTDDPPAVTVVTELAGVDPAEVELSVADGVLTIRGTRRRGGAACARTYHHMEIDYGSFERRIALDQAVDADAAEASYRNGVLTVVLPLVAAKTQGPLRVRITPGENA